MAKTSPKDLHFFMVMPPTESPKIDGLWGSIPPRSWQGGLSFCLWCGKEGQNEGTVVNHLWTNHYHLGLVCSWHSQLCMLALASIDDDDLEEESVLDDNGREYSDEFAFYED